MRISIVFGFLAIFALNSVAYAEESYRMETSGSYSKYDYSGGSGSETDVALEYFFKPVKTENHPYAEAAFLERIGSVGFSVSNSDLNAGSKGSARLYDLFLRYTTPNSPLVVDVELSTQKTDQNSVLNSQNLTVIKRQSDFYGVALGEYLSEGLLARIGFGYSKDKKSEVTSTQNAFFLSRRDDLQFVACHKNICSLCQICQ